MRAAGTPRSEDRFLVTNSTSCGAFDFASKRSYAVEVRRAPAAAPRTAPPIRPATRPRNTRPCHRRRQLARPTYHAPAMTGEGYRRSVAQPESGRTLALVTLREFAEEFQVEVASRYLGDAGIGCCTHVCGAATGLEPRPFADDTARTNLSDNLAVHPYLEDAVEDEYDRRGLLVLAKQEVARRATAVSPALLLA